MLRIISLIILLFSVLFLPFWVTLILAICGIVYFSIFIEAPIVLLLADLLYGIQEAKLFDMHFFLFLLTIVLLVGIEILKKKLKFYKN